MRYSSPRGTKDILPEEAGLWQALEHIFREMFCLYNYQEIRTPIFESTDLFSRSIGTTTDIVKKEMYTFPDRKGRSLTLRPEATAAVVRAALENNLISPGNLTKLYYSGPMFRYERPQAGRQRQFHQAGVEVFGSLDPLIDVETIHLSVQLFEEIGLKELEVELNSVGCKDCQPLFRSAIQEYFKTKIKEMCQDCRERLELNPLRILDCKETHCQKLIEKAPSTLDYLCPACKTHFEAVTKGLENAGVKFRLNARLVRGLDYYTKTVFEVVSKQLGAQNAVCGGGRYDNLVEEFGGKPIPAIGFAVGMERVVEILKGTSEFSKTRKGPALFVATLGEEARRIGFKLLSEARKKGISAEMDFNHKSLKAQMKAADRMRAEYVYIIGDNEIESKIAKLKQMETAREVEIPFENIIAHLSQVLGENHVCCCD